MTAHLTEVHVRREMRRWGWFGYYWRIEEVPPGEPRPDAKFVDRAYLKRIAVSDARRHQRWLYATKNQPSELVVHDADGTIADRSTYPPRPPYDPRGRG